METSVRGLVAMLADETIPAAERNSALKAVVERMEYSREGGALRLKAQLRGF